MQMEWEKERLKGKNATTRDAGERGEKIPRNKNSKKLDDSGGIGSVLRGRSKSCC